MLVNQLKRLTCTCKKHETTIPINEQDDHIEVFEATIYISVSRCGICVKVASYPTIRPYQVKFGGREGTPHLGEQATVDRVSSGPSLQLPSTPLAKNRKLLPTNR